MGELTPVLEQELLRPAMEHVLRSASCGKRAHRYHRGMAMIATEAVPTRAALAPAAALFRSLADPARLAILQHLAANGQASSSPPPSSSGSYAAKARSGRPAPSA